jgi:hypothetical protein
MFQPGGVLGVCPTESDHPRAGVTLFDVAIVGPACPSVPWPSHRSRFASDSVLLWVVTPTTIGWPEPWRHRAPTCNQAEQHDTSHEPLRWRSGLLPALPPLRAHRRSTSRQLPPGSQAAAFAGLAGVAAPSGERCASAVHVPCGSRLRLTGGVAHPRGFAAVPAPSVTLPAFRQASWNSRVSAASTTFVADRPPASSRLHRDSRTAHLVAEAVKPRAIWRSSPGLLATLQGLTGRPCSGFRRRSLHALAVPHRPLLEPQGIYRSHCGDSDCAEPPLPPGLSTLVSWPRLRWAACLAHGFTANTERVAASPLFASAGSRHLDQREAGLPRSGLSGRW